MFTRIRDENIPMTVEATDRDIFNKAAASGKTIKQEFIDKEMSTKGSEVNLYDVKMGLSKRFTDGVEGYYATNAFEILDITPNMPLSNFYYQSVMPLRFGGGFAEGVGAFRVNLAMAKGRLSGSNTNQVNVTGVDREKLWVPTYTIKLGLILGNIDWLKAKQINYDLLGLHTQALQLSYQREVEYFTMIGNDGLPNITDVRKGLLNMPESNILEIHDLETTPLNGMKRWEEFDLNDWVEFVIDKITQHLVAVQFKREKAINLIAVPTALFALWSKAAVVGAIGSASGTGVVTSIRKYLLEEINYRLNTTVQIVEIPYLDVDAIADKTTARIKANGTNGTGRMIFMRSDESVIRTHIPLALTGGQLAWSPTEDAYRQNHTAVVSVPLVLYPETLFYIDNGTTATEEIPEGLFTLTLPTPDNGTITSNLSALTNVPSGKLVRLTIKPTSTYEVDDFIVNGVDRSGDIGEDGTFVFRIFADTVVKLTFKSAA